MTLKFGPHQCTQLQEVADRSATWSLQRVICFRWWLRQFDHKDPLRTPNLKFPQSHPCHSVVWMFDLRPKQAFSKAGITVAHSMGKKNLVKKRSSESFLPDLYFFGEPFAMPVESDKHRSNFLKIQNKYVLCNWAYIPSAIQKYTWHCHWQWYWGSSFSTDSISIRPQTQFFHIV